MELNLDTKIQSKKVIIGGQPYEVKSLTVKDQLEINKSMKGLNDESDDYAEKMIEFMSKCGVPVEVLYQMSSEQFKAFVEFASGTTEKK